MDIPAGIAATAAMTRQAITMEVIKASAKADQQVADILAQSAASVAALSSRGTNVNFSA
jgi:hypothetical protein